MSENPQQTDPDVPTDDELEVEGPNESTQPSGAPPLDDGDGQDSPTAP